MGHGREKRAADLEQNDNNPKVYVGAAAKLSDRLRDRKLLRGKRGKVFLLFCAIILIGGVSILVWMIFSKSESPDTVNTEQLRNSTARQIELGKQRLETTQNDSEKLDTLLVLANNSYSEGQTEQAISYYEQALEIAPNSEEALGGLIIIYFDTKDQTNCELYLVRMIESIKNTPDNPNADMLPMYETMLDKVRNNDFSQLQEGAIS